MKDNLSGSTGSSVFRFKKFSLRNEDSAMKVGTDAVLLGAYMTLMPSDRRLLDIGTGTGVISLLAAQRLSQMRRDAAGEESALFSIEAIDIDGPSACEAAANFSSSPWSGNLRPACIPLQEFRDCGKFDCIFSNPPFFDQSLRNPDERENTARHTCNLSYREICAFAAEHLQSEGRLSLVLPATCEKTLIRTASSYGLHAFRLIRVQTTARKPPLRLIAEFSANRRNIEELSVNLQEPNLTALYYL